MICGVLMRSAAGRLWVCSRDEHDGDFHVFIDLSEPEHHEEEAHTKTR